MLILDRGTLPSREKVVAMLFLLLFVALPFAGIGVVAIANGSLGVGAILIAIGLLVAYFTIRPPKQR